MRSRAGARAAVVIVETMASLGWSHRYHLQMQENPALGLSVVVVGFASLSLITAAAI